MLIDGRVGQRRGEVGGGMLMAFPVAARGAGGLRQFIARAGVVEKQVDGGRVFVGRRPGVVGGCAGADGPFDRSGDEAVARAECSFAEQAVVEPGEGGQRLDDAAVGSHDDETVSRGDAVHGDVDVALGM